MLRVSLVLLVAGFAASSKVPTFTWLHDQASPDGVPLLSVDFHDGQPGDVVVLKSHNPLPVQKYEKESDVDKCIFVGHLRDEPDVYVSLTGGCPFEGKFEIKMRTKRHEDFMFKVVNGVSNVIKSPYKANGQINDVALHPPSNKMFRPSVQQKQAPKDDYTITLAIYHDQTFGNKFSGDEYNTMRRVLTHAQDLYFHPTLGSRMTLVFQSAFSIPDSIQADENSLNYVGGYNEPGHDGNVYLCYQNNESGTVGIAWIGTICGPQNYQTAVVEYFNNDLSTGEIFAHELGHNLGMQHDFNGSPGNPRYDSQGNSCTNIGGVMDYYQTVSR